MSSSPTNLPSWIPPGSDPDALEIDPDAPAPRLRVFAFGEGGVVEHSDVAAETVSEHVGLNTMSWVDVEGLGDLGVIEALGEVFDIHGLALEDVVNVHHRPKLEEYDDHLFIVLRVPSADPSFRSEQLTLFIGGDYLLTFQQGPSTLLDSVRNRLRSERSRLRSSSPDFLAYAVIDVCLDSYFPVLERCGEKVEALERAVLRQPGEEVVARIHSVKRELLSIRRALWPQRELLNGLLRDDSPLIGGRSRLYLRDCYDHVIQLIDLVETYREISTGLVDIYLSSVSSRMNEVMKVLTIIATVFIPLGFIAGLYGMNFNPDASPFNMPELDWYYGYPMALLIMLATACGLLYYFRRRGWLGGYKHR